MPLVGVIIYNGMNKGVIKINIFYGLIPYAVCLFVCNVMRNVFYSVAEYMPIFYDFVINIFLYLVFLGVGFLISYFILGKITQDIMNKK